MVRFLSTAFLFVPLLLSEQPLSAYQNKQKSEFSIGGYIITDEVIEREGIQEHEVTLSKDGQSIFKTTSPRVRWWPNKFDSLDKNEPTLLDLSGDHSFQHLILVTHSGGAHCCEAYHVLKLGPTFEHESITHHGNAGIEFKSLLGGPYTGYTCDEVLLYYKNFSYANSVRPDIILTFKGGKFVFDTERMKRPISQEQYDVMLNNIFKMIDDELKKEEKNLDQELLSWVMSLLYSGNAQLAWDALKKIANRYPLFLSGNNEDTKVLDWAEEKQNLINKIKESPYFQNILTINQGSID